MFDAPLPKLSAPIIQAIEDAVFLGHIKELDGVLELVRDDESFPSEMRTALETLLFYRIHYGKGGTMEPRDDAARQKALQMETLWGRQIIEMIGHYPEMGSDIRYA